jgi:hypothetical protein
VLITTALAFSASRADAPPAQNSLELATPDSDHSNYLSDRINFQFAKFVRRLDMRFEAKTATPGCAPAGTSFKGIGKAITSGVAQPIFTVTAVPDMMAEAANHSERARCPADTTRVQVGDIVLLEADDMLITPPDRFGLTYGTLMVPFKYHLKGNKDFTGGTSLGGYLGFRQDRSGWTGLGLQYVGFLGAAMVSVPQTVDGQTTSQNMAGVSYGIGVLGTVKDAFHMGLVLGADRVNASAHYKDNGKVWIAVSLGFDFSN